jgi:purine nucleosidase
MRIVLDTDLAMGEPGSEIDDGFALALACADPELELELVTTVNGNTDVETATLLSIELAGRLGRPDLPVVRGAAAPLLRPDRARQASQAIREAYGHHQAHPGHAAEEIVKLVMANPGEITVVAIGPLTNIAVALSLEPMLATTVREIVVMGGKFLGQTLDSRMPGEFNIWVDPEAAYAVLRSGAKLRLVGLDVTLQVRLTREHVEQMRAAPGSFSSFAGEYTATWIDRRAEASPGDASQADSCAMHDPLAVAVVTHPELVTWTPAYVDVVVGDGIGRGVMVTDLLGAVDPPSPNCQIATDVAVADFMNHFLASIGNL